jgi:hypothetical protein
MIRLIFTLLATILFFSTSTNAQQRTCAAHDNHVHMLQTNPQYATNRAAIDNHTAQYLANPHKTRAVKTIPVVVHVLYNTALQNISDAQILSQIAVLNADFRKLNANASTIPAPFVNAASDCEINFCLAQQDPNGNATNGITRTQTAVTNFTQNDYMKFTSLGGKDAWDRDEYLNIWVCKISGYLGYAQFPGGPALTDGVVISYRAMGTMGSVLAPYNLGRTATHEVGHWLNLFHIWGDDNGSCGGSDIVDDTPNQGAENYGSPVFPRVSCSNGPHGDMFMNYMDYSDDVAMSMFTNDQKARMDALFTTGGLRASLLTSMGCQAPFTCTASSAVYAANITETEATINWVASTGATSYNVQYKQSSSTTWTTINTNTNTINLSSLTASTSYGVQVQTVCNIGNSNYTTPINFTTLTPVILPCSTPSNLNEANVTTTNATITWDAVPAALQYKMHYKSSNSTQWIDIITTTNKYTFTNLTPNSDYYVEVQTLCASGTSSFSPTYVLTTLIPAIVCTSTSYEPNNTKAASVTIPTNTPAYSQVQISGDADWYKFTTTATQPKLKVTLTNLPADYDMYLYNATSSFRIGTSQNGGTSPEQIVYNQSSSGSTYFLRVFGYNGANNNSLCYTLNIATSANNLREDLVATQNDTKPTLDIYPNPSTTEVSLNYFAAEGEEAVVNIFNTLGQKINTVSKTSMQGQNTIINKVSNYPAGMYMMELVLNGETSVQKFTVTK